MARAILKKNREARVESGHPWVFASDVERVVGSAAPGDAVDVMSERGRFLGRALYNPRSQIMLRVVTERDEPVDEAFFVRRLEAAWAHRLRLCDPGACRVAYSESDGLPGLILDKFGETLVMQTLSLGIDRYKRALAEAAAALTGARRVCERNDAPVRRLEGLELVAGPLVGDAADRAEFIENGLRFTADVRNGQKTGYFLDQRENRAALAPLARGARVLDCFCHTGSFAIHASGYGAADVVAVDASEDALGIAREHAAMNGRGNVEFVAANCFDYLRTLTDGRRRFDLIVLDPPAFAKSRSALDGALRGYKEINLRGMRLIEDGGFLVTCSCSHPVGDAAFYEMALSAAKDAKRSVRLIEARTQARDHPIRSSMPESKYLKCLILQVYR